MSETTERKKSQEKDMVDTEEFGKKSISWWLGQFSPIQLTKIITLQIGIIVIAFNFGIWVSGLNIKAVDSLPWAGELEIKQPNVEYNANTDGVVFVTAKANPGNRSVSAAGYIGALNIFTALATDSFSPGVVSNNIDSFSMPITSGQEWRVEVIHEDVGLVDIRWQPSRPQ